MTFIILEKNSLIKTKKNKKKKKKQQFFILAHYISRENYLFIFVMN